MGVRAEISGFGGNGSKVGPLKRGFYPKGGGEVMVRVLPMWAVMETGKGAGGGGARWAGGAAVAGVLGAVETAGAKASKSDCLQPISLTDQGHAVRVSGRIFVYRTNGSTSGSTSETIRATIGDARSKTRDKCELQLTAVQVAKEAVRILSAGFPEAEIKDRPVVGVGLSFDTEDTGKGTSKTNVGSREVVTVGVLLILHTSTGCVLASEKLDNWDEGSSSDGDKSTNGAEGVMEMRRAATLVEDCVGALLVSA
jgi:hypothetical protein